MLGYSQRDFLTAKVNLKDLIHPDDAGMADYFFSNGLEIRTGCINIRLRHADGRIRCVKGCFTKKPARAGENVVLELTLEDARSVREPGDAFLLTSFKPLIEHTNDYIYIENRNHVILAVSPAVPFLTEVVKDPAELVGKTIYDLVPEAIADLSYELANRAFAENRSVHQIRQMAAQDGSNHWLDDRKYPITGPDGKIVGILGVVPDITEYVESRLRLRDSEESLREAQSIAGLGSYWLDINTGRWTSSDVLDQILGIEKEYERTVDGWAALLHPDDRSSMVAYFKDEVLGQGKRFDKEYRVIRRTDGALRWVHGLGRLEFDVQGRPVKMFGTTRDITETRQAHETLREHQELLRLFIEHAPVALAMFDREMRYLAVSRRWLEMHFIDDVEVLGRSHYEIMPEIPQAWREEHRRCLAGEKLGQEERQLVRADGTVQWVRREILPWRTGDGVIGGIIIITDDITERKRAEMALRESEESLREAQSIAGLGSYWLDIDTGRWTSSGVLDQIFGIDKEYGRTVEGWAALIHPDDRSSMVAYFKDEVLGQCKPFDREYQVIRQTDGALRWVHGLGRLEFDVQGRPIKMPGTIRDITEARQAQETLRESRHLLQLFIEHAPVALAMFDREMRYVAASRKWIEDYGLVGREVIGLCHYEVFPEIPERWKDAHRRGLAGERQRSDEDRFDRADGAVQWVRWEIIPWRAGDGSVGGIVLFAEDITKRKATEERLRLAANVFTGVREGIVITDRMGTILDVNDAFSRISGYAREEVLGQNPRLLQSGLQSKEFYETMWNSLIRDGHWSGELWNRTKDGDIFAETLTINAIRNASGEVEQYVGLFSDITEIKEHKQELERVT
ncbi:MAG: PAS domain S-box protein, partial [Terracidiphilus sp.]